MGGPILNLDGYTDVPAGKIATVVTSLEMRARPAAPADCVRVTLSRVVRPELDWYRALFRQIGEDWLWTSRLEMTDAQLADVIHDPMVEIHTAHEQGGLVGLVELDFRMPGEAEIVFFGLVAESVGKGLGGPMMARALDRAWRPGIDRVWLHTCHTDHPAALRFYMREGFTPFRLDIEVMDDPRITGIIRPDACPHVPILTGR